MKKINSRNISLIKLAAISCLIPFSASASCDSANFDEWKECFIAEKLEPIKHEVNIDAFRQAQFLEKVIRLDQKQPEKKLNFQQYKKLIGIDAKIKRAATYYQENKQTVDGIAKKYDIEPTILVALLAMESDLGRVQGSFNIIDSLASLSFDGRRRAFFEKELINALKLSQQNNIDYPHMTGSWAGAMGQCQFMPSSYLNFAVDGDDDGTKDIWNSKNDALASAANYLIKNGWKKGATHIYKKKKGSITPQTLAKCKGEKICDLDGDNLLISIDIHDIIPTSYITGKNFKVLMHWNRSLYFSASAMIIANSITGKSNDIQKN